MKGGIIFLFRIEWRCAWKLSVCVGKIGCGTPPCLLIENRRMWGTKKEVHFPIKLDHCVLASKHVSCAWTQLLHMAYVRLDCGPSLKRTDCVFGPAAELLLHDTHAHAHTRNEAAKRVIQPELTDLSVLSVVDCLPSYVSANQGTALLPNAFTHLRTHAGGRGFSQGLLSFLNDVLQYCL